MKDALEYLVAHQLEIAGAMFVFCAVAASIREMFRD